MSEEVEIDHTQTKFVIADSTGKIETRGHVPAFMVETQFKPDGGSIVLGDGDPATSYVSDGAIVPRPANTAVLTGMNLTNLPVPCTISIDGTSHTCTDDHCDLEFTQPATYKVVVSAFPMLDATFEVTQA
jgi:hypothetical protein